MLKRVHKAEFFFFVLIALIGLTGFFCWSTFRTVANALNSGMPVSMETVYRTAFISLVFSASSIVCGIFLVYPTIWWGLREQGELRRMTASLSARSRTLEYAAVTDPLTGLFNRRYFDDAMNEYLAAFRKIDKSMGLIIIDIDHFKQVNDTHGHDVGDEVLRRIAVCLREFTRYHDVLARLGGEEFAVLSPNITESALYGLADRIRNAVSSLSVEIGNISLRVTVSAGVAISNGESTAEELYKSADMQLYEAKRSGRNRVCA